MKTWTITREKMERWKKNQERGGQETSKKMFIFSISLGNYEMFGRRGFNYVK